MGAGAIAAAAGLAGSGYAAAQHGPPQQSMDGSPSQSMDPDAAWRKLIRGNERFVLGRQHHPHEQLDWRRKLVDGQRPFACVLGCADSRVTPELVFDHGLGDLFTVRAVGEVLDDAVVASIEYAVEHLGVRLIVVLGHESCGAVSAAVDLVRNGSSYTGAVSTVARAIEATVLATPAAADPAAFLDACVKHQARRVVQQLQERSAVIREAAAEHAVLIPARYDLDEFRVTRC